MNKAELDTLFKAVDADDANDASIQVMGDSGLMFKNFTPYEVIDELARVAAYSMAGIYCDGTLASLLLDSLMDNNAALVEKMINEA